MRSSLKENLRNAIRKALILLRGQEHSCKSEKWNWSQNEESQWQGQRAMVSDVTCTSMVVQRAVHEIDESFSAAFKSEHPEYHNQVGLGSFTHMVSHAPRLYLAAAIIGLWEKYERFDLDDLEIEVALSPNSKGTRASRLSQTG